jgi:hypothetical protein
MIGPLWDGVKVTNVWEEKQTVFPNLPGEPEPSTNPDVAHLKGKKEWEDVVR